MSGFFQRNKWETHHDLKKVMSQIAMLQKEKSKRQQKPLSDSSGISYKGTGNFLSLEAQTLLAHRCDTQEWVAFVMLFSLPSEEVILRFLKTLTTSFQNFQKFLFQKNFFFDSNVVT